MANGRLTHDGPTQAVLADLQRQGVAQVKTADQLAAEEAAAANAAAAKMSGAA